MEAPSPPHLLAEINAWLGLKRVDPAKVDAELRLRTYLVGHQLTRADTHIYELVKSTDPMPPHLARWAKRVAQDLPLFVGRGRHDPTRFKPNARGVNFSTEVAKEPKPGKAKDPAKEVKVDAEKKASGAGNFLATLIEDDLAGRSRPEDHGHHPGRTSTAWCKDRKQGDRIRTRFPPEPNGYLHIGHAKSICTNFGLAAKYGGRCHLRFDDTNPEKEKMEYINAIIEDVKWLGFDYGKHLYYASMYFDTFHEWATLLIKKGMAYIDSQNKDDMRKNRGTPFEPGKDSPFRSRTVEENLKLWEEMTAGKHKEGTHVVRAKIDMKHNNMNMRDPPIYRILHKEHPKTGKKWCVYPIYDFAHGQEDAVEGITHSFCTLEFRMHRELYDWFIERLPILEKQLDPAKGYDRPYQTEFARLELKNTVVSKRKLLKLVETKTVDGWDDPRMSTLCGLRRRGVPAAALRRFCEQLGVTKSISRTHPAVLEDIIRDELADKPRRMAVLNPLKVVITNYDGKDLSIKGANHPEKPELGTRELKFSKEIFIDREDFRKEAPPDFYRLKPGGEVKLRWCYVIKCNEVVEKNGEVVELRCTYDPATLEDMPKDRKVKGVVQWVSAQHAVKATVRILNPLLLDEEEEAPAEPEPVLGEDEEEEAAPDSFLAKVNPESLVVYDQAVVEPSLKGAKGMETFQFERQGFFTVDPKLSKKTLVFNRTVGLVQSGLAKAESKDQQQKSRKDEQAAQAAAKEAKKKIRPNDMFKPEHNAIFGREETYTKFDNDGVPTHDADGKELPKSGVKKLKKDWEKQKKLFESK